MTVKVIVNGRTLTESESKQHTRERVALHGGIAEIVASRGRGLSLNTDTTLIAQCYSSEPEWRRRQIAMAARRAGRCEEQAYDPTLADSVLDPNAMFEGRGARKRRIEHESRPLTEKPKPVHRLHPRLVREVMQKMAEKDPDVLRRDRRELVEEITERHGSKE